ncbi:MAG TPA: hypothetical protein VGM30_10400 [Puia sp.]|jgi:hypothetical protein
MDTVAIQTRRITVVNNVGKNKRVLESAAAIKGDLVSEMSSQGISVKNMRMIVGGSKVTLDSSLAVLPVEDFYLFLYPVKVDSGNWPDTDDDNGDDGNGDEQGTAENFNYEEDDVEEFQFDNSKEEMRVRLNLIIKGSEQTQHQANAVLNLLDNMEENSENNEAGHNDPEQTFLVDEAARIANSLNS